MSFIPKGNLLGDDGRMTVGGPRAMPFHTIIKNSGVVQIGDLVTWNASGFISRAAATEMLLGVVMGVASQSGNVDPDSGTRDTWTVASDNQTVAQKYAIIDISPFTIYSGTVDGTLGTTVASDQPGGWFDITDHNSINEVGSRTVTTGGQLLGLGPDPDNSSRMLCILNESFLKSVTGAASGAYQA